MLGVIECKDWSSKVRTPAVDAFKATSPNLPSDNILLCDGSHFRLKLLMTVTIAVSTTNIMPIFAAAALMLKSVFVTEAPV